jgi:hypothetical protein
LKLQNVRVNDLKTLKIQFLDFGFLKKHWKIGNESKCIENMFLSFFIFFSIRNKQEKIDKKHKNEHENS